MLQIDRASVTSFCESAAVTWCEDPTNADESTVRGRLRAEVLPALESMRAGVARRIAAGTAVRAAASAALDPALRAPEGDLWSRGSLAAVDPGLRAASIHRAAVRLAGSADGICADQIQSVCLAVTDGRRHRRVFECGCSVMVAVEAETVRITG